MQIQGFDKFVTVFFFLFVLSGEVERLLKEYRQNQELVRRIGGHYYQIIYPVQLRHHEKMGISTREVNQPKVQTHILIHTNKHTSFQSINISWERFSTFVFRRILEIILHRKGKGYHPLILEILKICIGEAFSCSCINCNKNLPKMWRNLKFALDIFLW